MKAALAPTGSTWQASALWFPAPTATNTPDFHRFVTAVVSALSGSPAPSDMFATAGLAGCAATQSTPATTSEVYPTPDQSNTTRRPGRKTPLAHPYVAEPT